MLRIILLFLFVLKSQAQNYQLIYKFPSTWQTACVWYSFDGSTAWTASNATNWISDPTYVTVSFPSPVYIDFNNCFPQGSSSIKWDNNNNHNYFVGKSGVGIYNIVTGTGVVGYTPVVVQKFYLYYKFPTTWVNTCAWHSYDGQTGWTNSTTTAYSSTYVFIMFTAQVYVDFNNCYPPGNSLLKWDNNNNANYLVGSSGAGIYNITNSVITFTPFPITTTTTTTTPTTSPTQPYFPTKSSTLTTSSTIQIYYYSLSNWNPTYAYYSSNQVTWTSLPGLPMQNYPSNWNYISVPKTYSLYIVFNDGLGHYDNNGGSHSSYFLPYPGMYKIQNGVITTMSLYCPGGDANPCTGHGSCKNYACTCEPGYFGLDCSGVCMGCSYGSTCNDGAAGDGSCKCQNFLSWLNGPGAANDALALKQIADFTDFLQNSYSTCISISVIDAAGLSSNDYLTLLTTNYLETESSALDVFNIDVGQSHAGIIDHVIDLGNSTEYMHIPSIFQNGVDSLTGKVFSLPRNTDYGLLYYRKDLCVRYNLTCPPQTWDELENFASTIQKGERIRQANPNFWGWGFAGYSDEGLTANMLEWINTNNGGSIIDSNGNITINNLNAGNALLRAKQWISTISPIKCMGMQDADVAKMFLSGNVAFVRSWTYLIANSNQNPILMNNFDIAPLPGNKGTIGGWGVSVSKYSRNITISQLFAEYLTGVDGQFDAFLINDLTPTTIENINQGSTLCKRASSQISQSIASLPINQCNVIISGITFNNLNGSQVLSPSSTSDVTDQILSCLNPVPIPVNNICLFSLNLTNNYEIVRPVSVSGNQYNNISSIIYSTVNQILLNKVNVDVGLKFIECNIAYYLGQSVVDCTPTENRNYVPITFIWAVVIFSGLGILIAILFCILTLMYAKSIVIRRAQPFFLLIVCIGVIITLVGNFFANVSDEGAYTTNNCMTFWWIQAIGFAISNSALIAKMLRIYQIMKASEKLMKVDIKPRHVLYVILIFVTLNVAVLSFWNYYDPFVLKRVTTAYDSLGHPTNSVAYCATKNNVNFFSLGAIALRFVVVGMGNVLCYITRKIDTSLNESRDISIAFFNSLQLMIIGVPVLYITRTNPPVYYILLGFLNVCSNLGILFFIFIPKFYIMLKTGDFTKFSYSQSTRKDTSKSVEPRKSTTTGKGSKASVSKPSLGLNANKNNLPESPNNYAILKTPNSTANNTSEEASQKESKRNEGRMSLNPLHSVLEMKDRSSMHINMATTTETLSEVKIIASSETVLKLENIKLKEEKRILELKLENISEALKNIKELPIIKYSDE